MLLLATTIIICFTVLAAVYILVTKGITVNITHTHTTPLVEQAPTPDVIATAKDTVDGVLAEIYDALDINVASKEGTTNE